MKASLVTGGAGQFMLAGTGVIAFLDFEIAFAGDTQWDLSSFRGRHTSENMGDIPPATGATPKPAAPKSPSGLTPATALPTPQ